MSWKDQQQKARKRRLPEVSQTVCLDDSTLQPVYAATADLEEAKVAAIREHVGTLASLDEEVDVATLEADIIDVHPDVVAAKQRLAEAEAARDAVTMTFTFRGLDGHVWEDLLAEHAPTEEKAQWNQKTFPPALIAACHVYYEVGEDGQPIRDEHGALVEGDGMTLADAQEIYSTFPAADRDTIFSAALAVNLTSRVSYTDLGKESGPTRD